ncbi:MAG: protein phosphatase 2C domain-containing protein [Anaerolineae bacterium]|nr:protein phosphatase 2C domain-containing protein [Anaerolineae bacterium]
MGNTLQWRTIGESVRGASHIRVGMPNQDAIRWWPESGLGPPLVLAVSDGHGSAKSFRSDIGSQLAVEKTVWVIIQDLLEGQPDPSNLSAIKRTAEERLPQELVWRWQEAVKAHLDEHPFSDEELKSLEESKGAQGRLAVERNPYLAYGATILSVLVTETFILYIQLGDGDILTVSEDGKVSRPLERDARLIANETTSLCMKEAWHDIQLRFQTLYGIPPALILLSTDGYANSFVNETAFRKVGSDILNVLKTDGLQTVKDNLPAWLNEASEAGSGDDITLGLVFQTQIPGTEKSSPHQEEESTPEDERVEDSEEISADEQPAEAPEQEPQPAESEPTPGTPPPLSLRNLQHKETGAPEPMKTWEESSS